MKRAINRIYHTAGAVIVLYGMLLAVKAAGIADLDGDETEMIRTVICSIAALACGMFVRWWRV